MSTTLERSFEDLTVKHATQTRNEGERKSSAFIRAERIRNSRVKRIADVTVAAMLLLVLCPVLSIVAIAIIIESGRPVLFRQTRYGQDKKKFKIVKFRTMNVMESEGSFLQARVNDKRCTRVGKVLRHSSLDELPQLLNVILGEMSLVGPRPHAVPMDDAFESLIIHYADRHLVRPGMTGLAQVAGYRGPTNTQEAIELRLKHDLTYITQWSIGMDMKILLKTPLALVQVNAV